MKKIQHILRKPIVGILISIVMGFLVGAVILMVAGYNPATAYGAMLRGIFSKPKYLAQVVIRSTPIILTGLSVAFAFQTGLFNIGAEGQFIMGTIAAVLVGYKVPLPPVIHFIAVVAAAMIAAGLWGAIVGFLKAKFGIHEVITSIMLNWIALYLNNFTVTLPWMKKPGSESTYEVLTSSWIVVLNNWKTSPEGREQLMQHPVLADVFIRTDFNYGILIAIVVVAIVWFILNRTTKGFELRAVGFNKDASQFAGIDVKKNIIISMAIAGAISGIAGALFITGAMPHRISVLSAMQNYGFDGISVALIANSSPFGVILSGLLFGGLKYGGASIQSEVGAPSEIINIVIGVIVFFVAMSSIFRMIADYLERKGEKKNA